MAECIQRGDDNGTEQQAKRIAAYELKRVGEIYGCTGKEYSRLDCMGSVDSHAIIGECSGHVFMEPKVCPTSPGPQTGPMPTTTSLPQLSSTPTLTASTRVLRFAGVPSTEFHTFDAVDGSV